MRSWDILRFLHFSVGNKGGKKSKYLVRTASFQVQILFKGLLNTDHEC